MAKGKKARSNTTLTRKQLSRRKREKQQLRWVWVGVGILVALVVITLATGLVLQNTQSVATVNDEAIRLSDYQKRLRFLVNFYEQQMPGALDNLDTEQRAGFYRDVVDQLIEEKLIRQEAQKVGLTVSDQEIQQEIEETWFQHYRTPPTPTPLPTLDPEATPTEPTTPLPTPTPDTEEAFQTRYQEFVDQVLEPAGLNEAYLRQVVETSLLRDRLQTALVPTVPTEEDQVHFRYATARDDADARRVMADLESGVTEQVHARHILVDTAEEANAALQRLQGGEDFGALAAELSTDESNKDQEGDLSWFGRGQMVPEFEQAAYEGEIGLYPTPVETQFGYHIIEVLAREDRSFDPDEKLTDAGWYGKPDLAERFGPLLAEMLFNSEIGLLPDPIPAEFGVMVVELLEHATQELDEDDQDARRAQLFQSRLDEIREEANIQDSWDVSMVPRDL
jgi:parvulin-like peptidyl-prolyl isomerase